jgi:hypothetical protein
MEVLSVTTAVPFETCAHVWAFYAREHMAWGERLVDATLYMCARCGSFLNCNDVGYLILDALGNVVAQEMEEMTYVQRT